MFELAALHAVSVGCPPQRTPSASFCVSLESILIAFIEGWMGRHCAIISQFSARTIFRSEDSRTQYCPTATSNHKQFKTTEKSQIEKQFENIESHPL